MWAEGLERTKGLLGLLVFVWLFQKLATSGMDGIVRVRASTDILGDHNIYSPETTCLDFLFETLVDRRTLREVVPPKW